MLIVRDMRLPQFFARSACNTVIRGRPFLYSFNLEISLIKEARFLLTFWCVLVAQGKEHIGLVG
jgi:hypothetical protein